MNFKYFKKVVATALLLLAFAVSSVSAADVEFPYFFFVLTDGSTHSLMSENLTITFANGQVVAANDTENVKIEASNVDYACFASSQSGLNSIIADQTGVIEVYSLAGVLVGVYPSVSDALHSVEKGVYVVKSNVNTVKIAVK